MTTTLSLRTDFGIRKVFDADGAVMVTFSNDEGGELAYGIFINGLIKHGGFALLSQDTGAYLVGNVGQLDGEPEATGLNPYAHVEATLRSRLPDSSDVVVDNVIEHGPGLVILYHRPERISRNLPDGRKLPAEFRIAGMNRRGDTTSDMIVS